ncbi:hypothetical protein TTHERM_000253467 (macronuclear) [Tetrahymena thermophila SB210]|uniref:Uncharacterized protein n=1 Tax=Tetrahymena thermophila (strain SB210) TaxID=312017 RepID=W7X2U1_TETTS|nr:hypothetical protein TTHERM_000253467 [Tetrahymena thermophila SB210]EWS73615.1 hypothetical protein TTHERM_000253467 [Tetrahymena thermophila SB210]|eukprot:XP_012653845.1 hypothetical protein TTHERM_000253467 [Tetrahymena thermophila SB210]
MKKIPNKIIIVVTKKAEAIQVKATILEFNYINSDNQKIREKQVNNAHSHHHLFFLYPQKKQPYLLITFVEVLSKSLELFLHKMYNMTKGYITVTSIKIGKTKKIMQQICSQVQHYQSIQLFIQESKILEGEQLKHKQTSNIKSEFKYALSLDYNLVNIKRQVQVMKLLLGK